jgi:hypothetical protein
MFSNKALFRYPIGLVVMGFAAFIAIQGLGFSHAGTGGKIQVTTYAYNGPGKLERVGNTVVHTKAVGNFSTTDAAHNCSNYNQTTNSDHSSAGYGQANFSKCWSGSGGTKAYQLSYVNPPAGYSFRSIHGDLNSGSPTDMNAQFDVREGSKVTNVEVWLDPPPKAASPASNPQPKPAAAPNPGSIQVTTYIYKSENNLERIGNTEVHVQSVDFATTDTAHNCNPYNLKTNSDHSSTAYGQAHFPNCWSGSAGTKAYQFSQLILPAGYTFRSIHSPDLRPDGYFTVHSDKETAVSIWMNPPETTSSGGTSGGGGLLGGVASSGKTSSPSTSSNGASHQVVSSHTITSQVASRQPNSALGNDHVTVGGAGPKGLDGDLPGDFGAGLDPDLEGDIGFAQLTGLDDVPPSRPGGLTANEEASGVVHLKWQVSSDNEGVDSYVVEKSVNGSPWEQISDYVTDTDFIDTATAYSQHYSYRVTAVDISGNNSEPSMVEITVSPFRVNAPSSPTSTSVIESPDGSASLRIQAGSTSENLDCGLAGDNQDGSDMLADYGDSQSGPYLPVCKDVDGDTVSSFNNEIDMTIDIDNKDISDDSDLAIFNGNDWDFADVNGNDNSDKAGKDIDGVSVTKVRTSNVTTFHVKTKDPKLFAIASKASAKSGPNWLVVLAIAVIAIAASALVLMGGKWLRSRGESGSSGLSGPGPSQDIRAYLPGYTKSKAKKEG